MQPNTTRTLSTLAAGVLLAAVAMSAGPAATAGPAAPKKSPALCGPNDKPEPGIQGDVAPAGGVNCGLRLLSEVPGGGSVQASGHCAYVRSPGPLPYTGTVIRAYSLANPLKPVQTDETPALGGSESMRVATAGSRAVLVSGKGVYDVHNCEHIVKKGVIHWPSINASLHAYIAATNSHELSISHDAKRVYTGLGFAIAYIDDLDHPETWTVKNNTCAMDEESGYPVAGLPTSQACEIAPQGDFPRQYSHSSDDNFKGTRWYGANQNGDGFSQLEPATLRIVDITDRDHIKIVGTLHDVPGHSMNWWRTPDGREFTLSANEGGTGDTCAPYPRPTSLGNAAEAYVTEVTDDKPKHAGIITVAINRPENCAAAKKSGSAAFFSEHSIYNKGRAAFAMLEYGGAGLRVWDLRDGYAPKEVAYYNNGTGHVHSGVFHYNEKTGIMVASGAEAMQVLMLEPQVIRALGLPKPTDARYPYLPAPTKKPTGTGSRNSATGALAGTGTRSPLLLVLAVLLIAVGAFGSRLSRR